MAYVLIEEGVVILKQPDPREGFVEAPEHVICGWLFANGEFSAPPPPVIDLSALDQEVLNHTLSQDGSIVRALGLLVFEEINKLRVKGGDAAYTMNQFKAALKSKMR